MKLICDERAKREVIDKLASGSVEEKILLKGYKCVHCRNQLFYIEDTSGDKVDEFIVVDIPDEDIWEIDKFQSFTAISKKAVSVCAKRLVETKENDYCIYVKRDDAISTDNCTSLKNIKAYNEENLQLNSCDMYLLIPGKIDEDAWESLPEVHSGVFDIFKEWITKRVDGEYSSEFAKKLERKCIGEAVLELRRETDDETLYRQNALASIVRHETGFCILEIIIQNCSIGGNKLLTYYCGNWLDIFLAGEKYDTDTILDKFNIQKYGKKRSIVFAYNDVSKEDIINALANEEFPMGKIGGDFQRIVETQNIAQYDTAEVYVSHKTMLEKCKISNHMSDERILYHVVEIFFVELILFQDAAVDTVYVALNDEGEKQRGYRDVKAATERYEQLSFDMAQAIRFGDYEAFNYPTVRESAKRIAKSFGIDDIWERYEMNKELLGAMISANKRRIEDRQDTVKNQFLLLLSALATVGTLGEILYVINEDKSGGILCYSIALLVVLGGFGIYKLAGLFVENVIRREKKH